MPTEKPQSHIEKYTEAKDQLAHFEGEHSHVFRQHQELIAAVTEAEEALKSECRQNGEEIGNDRFAAKPTESWRRWYDVTKVIATANKKELAVIETKAMKKEIDTKALDKLVIEGEVRAEVRQAAFMEKQLTTRVSVIALEDAEEDEA